jgi:hypothetical protein
MGKRWYVLAQDGSMTASTPTGKEIMGGRGLGPTARTQAVRNWDLLSYRSLGSPAISLVVGWRTGVGVLRVLFPARRLVDPDLLIPDLIRRDP